MDPLELTNAEQVLASINASGPTMAQLFGSTFDATYEVSIQTLETAPLQKWASRMQGRGLLFTFDVDGLSAVLALPLSGELFPDWCATAAAEEQQRLQQLAVNLAGCLLPEGTTVSKQDVAVVDLDSEFKSSGEKVCTIVPIELRRETCQQTIYFVWPLLAHAGNGAPASESLAALVQQIHRRPTFSNSLLKVRLPVVATLATSKEKVGRILDMAPGTIIQFNKGCDETLTLQIGDHVIARGEAVKVGEKFGMRLSEMVLPDERFKTVTE